MLRTTLPRPLTLHLPSSLVSRGVDLRRWLATDDQQRPWRVSRRLLDRFALAGYERRFARALLRCRCNLWLFRCSQRAFCGDFIVVDMSEPRVASRVARVIELKLGDSLVVGRGESSVQLANHRQAVAEISQRTGIVGADAACEIVRGDPRPVLAHLGLRG